MNVELSISPSVPIHVTAPPFPPLTFPTLGYNDSLRLSFNVVPNAWLSVKLQLFIVPLCPLQYTAPALRFARLSVKLLLANRPPSEFLFQSIAPPFVPASFESKRLFLTVVFLHSPSSSALSIKIAPPRYAALLLINVTSSANPCDPYQITAPPSPPNTPRISLVPL